MYGVSGSQGWYEGTENLSNRIQEQRKYFSSLTSNLPSSQASQHCHQSNQQGNQMPTTILARTSSAVFRHLSLHLATSTHRLMKVWHVPQNPFALPRSNLANYLSVSNHTVQRGSHMSRLTVRSGAPSFHIFSIPATLVRTASCILPPASHFV